MNTPKTTSSATTEGVLVQVRSQFLEEQSQPAIRRFVFAYEITITNNGSEVVQLESRHWIITDGVGDVEEVKGPGVVGEQPVLSPGEGFRYTSGAVLPTERGHDARHLSDAPSRRRSVRRRRSRQFLLERPHSLN